MESRELEKARAYAFLLLKYRLRSVREISDRMRRKGFPDTVIGQVTAFLQEKGFLDDKAFAEAWISSRARQKFGARRIRRELGLKGIEPRVIDAGLARLKAAGSEEETIRAIAGERLRKLGNIDRQTAKRRIYAYFLRRGFSPETVIDVLNGLMTD